MFATCAAKMIRDLCFIVLLVCKAFQGIDAVDVDIERDAKLTTVIISQFSSTI